ncbi:MAG: hypothetical protein ACRCW2_08500 [Cellulosilyticaceae bacterium]
MNFSIISEHDPACSLTQAANDWISSLFGAVPCVKHFQVTFDTLHACIGCFSCWLKTPGKCCFKDLSDEINVHMVQDELMLFVTPIQYGCYSPGIKKILDRSIPNVLPFFTRVKRQGHPIEIHHARRYKKIAKRIIIAYTESITPAEEATFIALTKANSINFHLPPPQVYICRTHAEIHNALLQVKKQMLKEVHHHA